MPKSFVLNEQPGNAPTFEHLSKHISPRRTLNLSDGFPLLQETTWRVYLPDPCLNVNAAPESFQQTRQPNAQPST
ncbi:MAG: hypothetical protein CMJ62_15605 [Planctomycetaceae bacterium]|jgi:hypothetical protein|nr:hypothetical protein [Planctomycetaceae bacterium]